MPVTTIAAEIHATRASAGHSQNEHPAEAAIDGNPATFGCGDKTTPGGSPAPRSRSGSNCVLQAA